MGIPASAFTVQTFSTLQLGELFRWRDSWCMKGLHTELGPPRRDTEIAVKLTNSEAGNWVPEPQVPSHELLAIAPSWRWRVEIDQIGAIREADAEPCNLVLSTAGLSIACRLDRYWTFAGLDGTDHYATLGYASRQKVAAKWSVSLVSPDGQETWPLFVAGS